MKSHIYLAATFLAGFAGAAVHNIKLQKISLSEQLVCLATSHIDLPSLLHIQKLLKKFLYSMSLLW